MGKVASGAAVLLAGLMILGYTTPTLDNLWSLVTGAGFFIPAESSVFTFRVTQENDGSGEWWLYGEDGKHFFALHSEEPVYLVFPRGDLALCPAFVPLDQRTWCPSRTIRVPHE